MNWRQREKAKYSFYVTGITVILGVVLLICAMVQQLFF